MVSLYSVMTCKQTLPNQGKGLCLRSSNKCSPLSPLQFNHNTIKLQVFIVELKHHLALYRTGCSLMSGVFVSLTFIKTLMNCLNRHCTSSQQNCSLNVCDIIMQNFHSNMREINLISEAHTSVLLQKTWGFV